MANFVNVGKTLKSFSGIDPLTHNLYFLILSHACSRTSFQLNRITEFLVKKLTLFTSELRDTFTSKFLE